MVAVDREIRAHLPEEALVVEVIATDHERPYQDALEATRKKPLSKTTDFVTGEFIILNFAIVCVVDESLFY